MKPPETSSRTPQKAQDSAGKRAGSLVVKNALRLYAHMALSILFAVILVYLALYYTLILPFYGGFTDDAAWYRLKVSLFTGGFALVSAVWLFVVYRKRAYASGTCSVKSILLSGGIAVCIHAVLTAVFQGIFFISGAPYFCAWLVTSGGVPLEDGARVPLGVTVAFLLAFDAAYVGVTLLASFLGARARKKDRADVLGHTDTNNSI